MELLLHSLKPCPTQTDMVWEPREEELGLREENLGVCLQTLASKHRQATPVHRKMPRD